MSICHMIHLDKMNFADEVSKMCDDHHTVILVPVLCAHVRKECFVSQSTLRREVIIEAGLIPFLF